MTTSLRDLELRLRTPIHVLTETEAKQLRGNRKLSRQCGRGHPIRDHHGKPTRNMILEGAQDADGRWWFLEYKGCRACRNESRNTVRRQTRRERRQLAQAAVTDLVS